MCFAVNVSFVEVEHPIAIDVPDVPSQELENSLDKDEKTSTGLRIGCYKLQLVWR